MDKLESLFSTYSKPSEVKEFDSNGCVMHIMLRNMSDFSHPYCREDKVMADMHEVYSQSVFMVTMCSTIPPTACLVTNSSLEFVRSQS